MIVLSKTPTAQVRELKQKLAVEQKKYGLHGKHAHQTRQEILSLASNAHERDQLTNLLGKFVDYVRFADKAQRNMFEISQLLNRVEQDIPKWG